MTNPETASSHSNEKLGTHFPAPEDSNQWINLMQSLTGENQHDLYHALINASPDGIFITDLAGKILFISPAVLKLLEINSQDEILGTSALDWVDAQDQSKIANHIQEAATGAEVKESQYSFNTKLGHKFIGEINATLLHSASGQRVGFIATIRDISEIWKEKEVFKQSEQKFRNVVESSPMGMHFYRLEADNRLILEDANFAADQILKITHAGLFGKTIEEAFPGLVETNIPAIYRMVASDGGQWRTDQINYNRDEISGAYEVVAFQTSPDHMVATFLDITERKRAELALNNSLENLKLLRKIDQVIIEHDDIHSSLEALVNLIARFYRADGVEILLYDPARELFQHVVGTGLRSTVYGIPFPSSIGTPGLALRTRKPVYLPDIAAIPSFCELPFIYEEQFVSSYSVPLITPFRVQGVLQMFFRTRTQLGHATLDFLEMVAKQVAIAVEKTSLWENHHKALEELQTAYATTLEGWVYALDLRDNETEHHTRRVTDLTMEVATAMGATLDRLTDIRYGALLHDIGKIGIPDAILYKQGELTDEEWLIMRKHPIYAKEMLQHIQYLQGAIDIPYCHHERWDGSGYPRGLKGEEIPLEARIFAVVDVWDALTSDRPYRRAWTKDAARRYLMENSGKLFDFYAVKCLFQVLSSG